MSSQSVFSTLMCRVEEVLDTLVIQTLVKKLLIAAHKSFQNRNTGIGNTPEKSSALDIINVDSLERGCIISIH